MSANGHKATEVGILPEDWQCFALGSVASLYQPTTISARQLKPDGFPVYGANGIVGYYDKSNHDTEQVTITCRGSTCGVVNRTVERCWITGNAMVANVDANKGINKRFFYHLLSAQDFSVCITGSGQPQIVRGPLANFMVAIPPLIEQDEIAKSLDGIDDLIASLDALIAKKRDIKQAAMRLLLTGGKRLTGFSGKWESKPLSNIADFITKGATPTTYGFGWQSDGILFLRSECVADDGLDLSQSMFVSEEAHRALRRGEVRAGDILMTITGNVGRVVMLPPSIATANINQHIARIRIRDGEAVPRYIFHHLAQQTVRENFCSIVTGQEYPQISLRQVRDAIVPLPSLPEQEAIACVLSDMDDDISVLEEKQSKAKRLREGMMQQLLTGRIRLV